MAGPRSQADLGHGAGVRRHDVRSHGERRSRPPLPSNGNQRDRVGAMRPPAPLPQIPAAPLSRRLLRANSGAMAAAIAPQGDLKGVEGMEQDNRESWLNRVAAGMAPLFAALDAPLPARIRVAIGFTSSGRKRSEEHTSELQSLMRISYAVSCLTNKSKTSKYRQL